MILGEFHPFEDRRFIGRATDHVPYFSTALFRQVRIRLSQSGHNEISSKILGDFSLIVNL